MPHGKYLPSARDKDSPFPPCIVGIVGIVRISKIVDGETIYLVTLNEGELFGEMGIIDGCDRMACAEALDDTALIRISSYALDKKLQKYDKFMRALIRLIPSALLSWVRRKTWRREIFP